MEGRLTRDQLQEKDAIIRSIEAYITKIGSSYSNWVVGVTHSHKLAQGVTRVLELDNGSLVSDRRL